MNIEKAIEILTDLASQTPDDLAKVLMDVVGVINESYLEGFLDGNQNCKNVIDQQKFNVQLSEDKGELDNEH